MGCSPLPSFRPFELLEVDESWSDSWPKKIGSFNVTVLPFYLKLFRESQRFQWYHLCRAWWSGLDPSPRRQSWFQLKGISWELWKNFMQLMILMCLARHSNDKCFATKRHFQWWIMASSDESWHHHDITMTFSWHPPFHVKQIKQICENWCSVMAHLRVSRSMV